MKFFKWYSLISILLCLGFSLVVAISTNSFLRSAHVAKGRIVELKVLPGDKGGNITPYFKFEVQGKQYEVINPHMADASTYKLNDLVDILFEPSNPQNAMIRESNFQYYPSVFMLGLGLIIFLFWYYLRKKFIS